MNALIVVGLALLGVCLGSFVNALVWRIKTKRNFISGRSMCVHCHHQLAPLDLIPVLSWLILKAKCRYCGKTISWQYPIVELVVGVLFGLSFLLWPAPLEQWFQLTQFGLWLAMLVILVALFVYDVRWLLLPDKLTYPLIVIGLAMGLLSLAFGQHLSVIQTLLELLYGAASIGGFYALLFIVSKGKWVGLGDAKLGLALGLALGWQLGILTLVLANLLGTLVVLPGLLSKRLTRTSKIAFGPFLIIAFIITGLFGQALVAWYLNHLLLG